MKPTNVVKFARILSGALLLLAMASAAPPRPLSFNIPARDVSTGSGTGPQSVAVADFNGDGQLDVVTANSVGSVSVLLGNGQGGFGGANTFTVGTSLKAVVTGDFNGDGKVDLAVGDVGSNNVSILLGTGLRNFR